MNEQELLIKLLATTLAMLLTNLRADEVKLVFCNRLNLDVSNMLCYNDVKVSSCLIRRKKFREKRGELGNTKSRRW